MGFDFQTAIKQKQAAVPGARPVDAAPAPFVPESAPLMVPGMSPAEMPKEKAGPPLTTSAPPAENDPLSPESLHRAAAQMYAADALAPGGVRKVPEKDTLRGFQISGQQPVDPEARKNIMQGMEGVARENSEIEKSNAAVAEHERDAGIDRQAALQIAADSRAKLQEEKEAGLSEIRARRDKEIDDYVKSTVKDPGLYGETLGAQVANRTLAFLGAGLMGDPRPTLERLYRDRDANIAAQIRAREIHKDNATSLTNLMDRYEKEYGDRDTAILAAQTAQNELIKNRLEVLKASARSEEAKTKAQQLLDQLKVDQGNKQLELDAKEKGTRTAAYTHQDAGVVGTGPSRAQRAASLEKAAAAAEKAGGSGATFIGPDGQKMAFSRDVEPPEKAKVRDQSNALYMLKTQLNRTRQLVREGRAQKAGGVFGDSEEYRQAGKQLASMISVALQQGAITDSEAKDYKETFLSKDGLGAFKTAGQLNAALDEVETLVNSKAEAMRLNYSKGK